MNTLDPKVLGAAVEYAARAHETQFRKRAKDDPGYPIPYISHLLAAASMAIEDGADTNEAVAALLHDVIEDQNRPGRAEEIAAKFGERVLTLVEGCTGPKDDAPGMDDFRTRKRVYLDKLRAQQDPGVVRVTLADKVHNARSTVNDLEADGPAMWLRFNAPAEDQLWYYQSLVEAYAGHAQAGRANAVRAAKLRRLVDRMRDLTPGV